MTRLANPIAAANQPRQNPFAAFERTAADNPFAAFSRPAEQVGEAGVVAPPVSPDPPNLREFIGEETAQSLTPESALEQGHVQRFVGHLRQKAERFEPGSPERESLAKSITGLQRDVIEFEEQERAAKKHGVSREAAARIESPIGAAEQSVLTKLNQTAAGQILQRTEQALSSIPETVISLSSRAFGTGEASATLHREKRVHDEILTLAEKGGDVQAVLGESGSRIFNSIVESVPKYATAAFAGPAGVYAMIVGESYDTGLEEAKQNNITGLDAVKYAGAKATVEFGVTLLMGKIGQKLGFASFEESLSPAMRKAATKLAESAAGKNWAGKLTSVAGGAALESTEEGLIDAVQQGIELNAGTNAKGSFDWRRLFEAAGAGAASRGAIGAANGLAEALRKIPSQKIEETVKGVKAAEQAIAAVAETPAQPVAEQSATADPESTVVVSPATTRPTVRESIAAAEAAQGEAGKTGRGARGARQFVENATPELLEAARGALSQKEFAKVTGLKKTSQTFRDAFRDTLDLYATAVKTPAQSQNETPQSPAVASEATGTALDTSGQPAPQTPATKSPSSPRDAATVQTDSEQPSTPPTQQAASRGPTEGVLTAADSGIPTPATRTRDQRKLETAARHLEATRTKLSQVREASRASRVLREEHLNEAATIARENLRPEEAGRIIGTIRDVKSPASFQKFLGTVNDAVDRRERRGAESELRRAVNDAERVGRPEYRAQVKEVTGGIDVGPRRGKQSRERLAEIRKFLDANPEHQLPPSLLRALDRLERRPLSELSMDELRQATAALDSAAYFDSMKNRFLDARQQRTVEEVASTVKAQIGTVEMPEGTFADAMQVGRAARQAVARAAFRPEDVLDAISPDAKQLVWERILVGGSNAERTTREKLRRPVDSLLSKLNLSPQRGIMGQITGLTERSSLFESPLTKWRDAKKKIGGVTMTRGEATMAYLSMLDPQNAAVAQSFGFTFRPRILGTQKRQLPVNETTLGDIAEFIGDEGKQLAGTIFSAINTTARDAVNDAYLKVNGRILSDRTDYVPRKIDADAITELKGADEFLSRIGDTSLNGSGILQARTGGGPIEIGDVLDLYSRHIDTVARVSAYIEPVRDAFAVLKRRDVRDAIDAKGGPGATGSILDRISLQVVPSFDRTGFERATRVLVRGIVPAKLALKIGPMLLQPVGLLTSAARRKGGMKRLAESVALLASPQERYRVIRDMEENSSLARERYGGAWMREASGGMMGQRGAWRSDTLMDLSMQPLEMMEKQSTATLRWKQAESYVADELGIAPDAPMFKREVAREWERMIYRSENSSQGLEMNGAIALGRRNAFVAPFVTFTSAASKTASLLQHGKNQFASGDHRGGAATYSAYAAGIVAAALARRLAGWIRGREDEETILQSAIQEVAGHVPGGSETLQPLARHMMGLRTQTGRPNLLMGEVQAGVVGILALHDAFYGSIFGELELNDDGEPESKAKFQEAADKLAIALAPLARVPYEGVKDWANISANAFAGGPDDGEVAKRLREQIKESMDDSDTSDERKLLFRAIRTDDDELFSKTIRAVREKDANKLTPQWLRRIVESRYANLTYIEGKLARGEYNYQTLGDQQLEALNDLGAERQLMLDALYEMAERNL